MSGTLQHLSPEQIETLILRYYRNEKVTDLIEEYKLNVKPNQIIKLFPLKVTNTNCPNCEKKLVVKYHSRDSSPSGARLRVGLCVCWPCDPFLPLLVLSINNRLT